MKFRTPPSNASVTNTPDETGKLHAPSAARNAADLCDMVASVAPLTGDALEIASGTGQHIVAFAKAMPAIHWHPTEVDQNRLRSIEAYRRDSGLSNIAPPIPMNATEAGWSERMAPKGLILLANLLHLISKPEAGTLIKEAAHALAPSGQLIVYGPFKRDGTLTSEGDANFDASLRASDPEIGYKDDAWIKSAASDAGLVLVDAREMPANNLGLILQKL
ncbi:MAG: DUF938 domain-containing protein [Tateyamaria sp.]|uniref:DUF938 domain-containing protein n=1 Tax=Tateyamaria sp. TaxID=1929288 RepID=UPI00327A2037